MSLHLGARFLAAAATAIFAAAAVNFAAGNARSDGRLVRAHVDATRNVHVVTASGGDLRITRRSRYRDAKLASDGRTFGALVITEGGRLSSAGDGGLCERLLIYRDGKVVRSLAPGGFLRAWGFWSGGTHVAVYSGALHFAGCYALFDLGSGKQVASSQDPVAEESPPWVRALAP